MPRRELIFLHSASAGGCKFLVVGVSIDGQGCNDWPHQPSENGDSPSDSASFVEGKSEGITKVPIRAT